MTVSKYFKYLYCFALVLVSALYASAQELNINVKVDIQANLTVDKSIFSNLGNQISEFINNTKWTEEVFEQHEKISGSLQMNIINELDPTTFEAEIIFQTSRPVYNSNYETTIINFIDKNINFKYTGIEPILKLPIHFTTIFLPSFHFTAT